MAARKAAIDAQPARLNRGFTLVEIAVVIGIIALIVSALLPLISAQTANARINATRTRQDTIRTALITYVGQHGYLPCPADGWLLPSAAGYGHEARSAVSALPAGLCDGLGAGSANAAQTPLPYLDYTTSGSNNSIPTVSVYRGVVPWLDLGLPEEIINDAWNQRISYIVTSLGVTGYASRESISGMLGGLVVCSEFSSTAVLLTAIAASGNAPCTAAAATVPLISTQSAAVALISHGENGYGAFAPGGAGVRPYAAQASPAEVANIDLNKHVLVQSGYSRSFDDLVLWLTPADLTAPLIRAAALPSAQALTQRSFDQAKAMVLASIINRRTSLDVGSSTGNCYLLQQPVSLLTPLPGVPTSYTSAFANSAGKSDDLGLLGNGLPSSVAALLSAGTTVYFDGNNALINGTGSNRMPANSALANFDAWGNPLLFVPVWSGSTSGTAITAAWPPSGSYAYLLYSLGPDGVAGTSDDSSATVSFAEIQAALQALGTLSGAAPRYPSNPPHDCLNPGQWS